MIGYSDKRKEIPDDKYLFSVTQTQEYYLNPSEFFRKVILKEDIPFYNDATVLGTLVHYAISEQWENREVDMTEVNNYLISIPTEFGVNTLWCKNKFVEMQPQVLRYAKALEIEAPTEWEKNYIHQLSENVYIGGTLDVRYGNTILDFKTSSKLTLSADEELPQKYIDQLYTYAWILHQKGIAIDKIGVVYFTIPEVGRISPKTGKPMKDYPLQFIRKELFLNNEHMQVINDRLNLIAENIEYALKHKDALYLFAKDYRLKAL